MCTCTARDAQYDLSKKQNRIEISERKEFKAKRRKRKVKRREAKKRKERRRKKKWGSKGVFPFALQIQTFQKKERIKGLATKGKIARKKKRESREFLSQSCQ